MKRKITVVLSLVLTINLSVFAQTPAKEIHSRTQSWVAYVNQTRLTNKFGLWFEAHYRQTDNFTERPFQLLIRPAVTYFIKDNLRVNVGYAYIHHFPAKGLNTSRAEHRPWQQVWYQQKYPGVTMIQWLRLEQRYVRKSANDVLQEGYNFTNRLRYNIGFFVPLKGREIVPKTPFAVVLNELFINFGKNVTYNTFDQNRLFVGLGYQFTKHVNAHLGYMNLYQQEAAGNRYMISHTVRLFVYHNLDLRTDG